MPPSFSIVAAFLVFVIFQGPQLWCQAECFPCPSYCNDNCCKFGRCSGCQPGYQLTGFGTCVTCSTSVVPNCQVCSSNNFCGVCKQGYNLVSGSCVGNVTMSCPSACQGSCFSDPVTSQCMCYPFGSTYVGKAGDTLKGLAAMTNTNASSLAALNGITTTASDNQNAMLVRGVPLVMPPMPCTNAASTQCGPDPDNPNQSLVWMSCAGPDCPADPSNPGSNLFYQCVPLSVCNALYAKCLNAAASCPNCCFQRTCLSNTGLQGWAMMTFPATGTSAHCDPPPGIWGRR